MRDPIRSSGHPARVFLLALVASLSTAGLAFADSGQPRDPDPGDPPADDDAESGGHEGVGFVLGIEAGGGLLWNDRLRDRPGEAMGALTLGYDLGALRLEMEWLARATEEEDGSDRDGFGRGRSAAWGPDPLLGGFGPTISGLESETGQLFLNLYYDFETGTRVTPWVGIGGGWARTEVEYGVVTPGRAFPPSGAETGGFDFPFSWRALEFEGSDSVPGVQVLAGADVRMTERLSLGLKVRWSRFGRATFEGPGDGFDDLFDLLGSGQDSDPKEITGILDRAIGDLFVGAAHPFSIDLSGVAATLNVSWRF